MQAAGKKEHTKPSVSSYTSVMVCFVLLSVVDMSTKNTEALVMVLHTFNPSTKQREATTLDLGLN